jgi:Transmembrane protein 65/GAF domain
VQHPAALQRYLEKLTVQQRSEIHRHLLRQQQQQAPPAAATTCMAAETTTATAATANAAVAVAPEPSLHDLRLVAINTAIPFVGFGIMENSILIIAGDAIDTTLGVALGISTMCAAAIGNIISDVAGVLLGTFVEDFTQKYLAVPSPVLSDAQRKLRSVRYASQFGCAVGLVIGCIIGMFPLAFMDHSSSNNPNNKNSGQPHDDKIRRRRRRQQANDDIDTMCQEVVVQAGRLLRAEQTFLYILCDPPNEQENPSISSGVAVVANPKGKYLHAKYSSCASSGMDFQQQQQLPPYIPLEQGGIVSQTARTREVCNIYHEIAIKAEVEEQQQQQQQQQQTPHPQPTSAVKSTLCVPVLDGNDCTMGVLQVINQKANDDNDDKATANHQHRASAGFTNGDVQILKALSSHITVSLQRMTKTSETTSTENATSPGCCDDDDNEEEKMRLRDTIRILKDSGLVAS